MGGLYDALINKFVKATSLVRVERIDSEQTAGEERFRKPFVTISREPGSGGKPVARLVAEKLGFELYDEKLIDEVARSAHERKALLKKVDERGRTAIEDIIQSTFNPEYISDVTYIKHLSRVILSAAVRGEVVIMDHGANFITPFDKGLHVRICAPYAVRLQRAVKYEKISREKAVTIIKDTDRHRKEFIRQYFGKSISKANYYDLVVNTQAMSIENATELVLLAFRNKFPEYLKGKSLLFAKL